MPTHKRRLPIEGLSETEDALLTMVIAVTGQLSATRERLDTLEALLTRAGTLEADAVEQFVPTQDDAARRDTLRQAIVAKVMEPIAAGLQADRERLEKKDG